MRLAMAQMKMSGLTAENLRRTVEFMRRAKSEGADFIFFPEIQLSPFFPKYEKADAEKYLLTLDSAEIKTIQDACRELRLWASPNVYLELQGKRYDASLMINGSGEIVGISKMVHIYQADNFYEKDYYTPSDDGFKVYDTPFGKIGIVICFDRHVPESVRECARGGAELIIIPTANLVTEPTELFEWEIRVQAFHSLVYIAMCNRVGQEDELAFCGQSLIADFNGNIALKSDGSEGLIVTDVPLEKIKAVRIDRPWIREFL